MAIYGFGAYYDDSRDVSEELIRAGFACVGWPEEDAPPLHNLLRDIGIGDIVFLKSFTPQSGLTIKSVGIVTGRGPVHTEGHLGWGVPVMWRWQGEERLGHLNDKYAARTMTLFEEHNPDVQRRVVDLLLNGNALGRR